jgi:hypothetical protein
MISFSNIRYAKEYLIIYILLLLINNKYSNYIGTIGILFIFFFFRKTKIVLPKEITNNTILSPCYGKIKQIINTDDFLFIKIHLRIFDEHHFIIPTNSPLIKKSFKNYEENDLERITYRFCNGVSISSIVKKLNNKKFIQDMVNLITFKSMFLPKFIYQNRIIDFTNTNKKIGEQMCLIRFGSECQIFYKKKNTNTDTNTNTNVFLYKKENDIVSAGEKIFEII